MSVQASAEAARNDLIRIQRWIAGNATVAATPAGQKLLSALVQARSATEMLMLGKTQ